MGAVLVVVGLPVADHDAGVGERPEEVNVQTLIPPAAVERFWSTMQRELLDTRRWATREQLGSAIFEWIEAWCNLRRRHTSLKGLSRCEFEALHAAANQAA